MTGITGSTGIAFAAPFAATVAVGRLGCFFAGLADYTYGTPTGVPWGVDFGDGIRRHPVQLYEVAGDGRDVRRAAANVRRARSLLARQRLLSRRSAGTALQRFVWEFFKPYATIVGPFNLFHLVCLGLVLYAGRDDPEEPGR